MFSRLKHFKNRRRIDKMLKNQGRYLKIDTSAILMDSFNIDINVVKRLKETCIKIGRDSLLECNLILEKETGNISIGNRTYISGGTSIISIHRIEIGNDVTIAWGCTIYDHDSHSVYWNERSRDTLQCIKDYKKTGNFIQNKNWSKVKSAPIKIEDKVWIGFDCLILKGVTIGEGAVIGAKSVVTHDVPPYTIVAGNPARVVKTLEKEKKNE